jgi:hypothetical protein
LATMLSPMVVGGPRLDCPTSASTMAICRSCPRRQLANQVRKVVFPVSVAPRSKIVRARWRSSNAAFQLGCSMDLTTAYTFPPLEPTTSLLALVHPSSRCECPHNRGVAIIHLTVPSELRMRDGPPDTGATSISRKLRQCVAIGFLLTLASHMYGSAYIRLQMPPRSTTMYCQ